jgi:hypothetical protein
VGTHAKLAITTSRGHWCVERTMDGVVALVALFGDWYDTEHRVLDDTVDDSPIVWTPHEPSGTPESPRTEIGAIFDAFTSFPSSQQGQWSHDTQEHEQVAFVHFDFTRSVLTVDTGAYGSIAAAPGDRFQLSDSWTLQWGYECPGVSDD